MNTIVLGPIIHNLGQEMKTFDFSILDIVDDTAPECGSLSIELLDADNNPPNTELFELV